MNRNTFVWIPVIVLVCGVLATGCRHPTNPTKPDPQQGYGTVSITFGGGNARTLLPSAFDLPKLHYVLAFTQAGGSGQVTVSQNGSGSITQQLDVGTWNLVIRGYNTPADASVTSNAVVYYAQNNIAVTYGESTTIYANLLPNLDNLTQIGNGTLRYGITFPAGSAGTLKIYTYPNNIQVGSTIVLTETENSGVLELSSGYYYIIVNTEYQGRVQVWTELAHINDNAITEAIVRPDDFTDYLPPPGPVDIYLTMDKFTITDEAAGIFADISPIALDKRTGDIRTVAVDGLIAVEWRVGDAVLGTGNSITLSATVFSSGIYTLNLAFLKNGKYWLGSIRFEVTVTGNLPDDYFELITEANKSSYWDNTTQQTVYYDANVGTYRVVRGSAAPPNEVYIPTRYNGLPVTEIGRTWETQFYGTFEGRANITAVHIPEGITAIGADAFTGTSITNITFPASLMSIGYYSFKDCTSLTSITIPASVTYIYEWSAFYGCTSVTSINVDNNNPNYASEGGILYSKDKTRLFQVPVAGISGHITIPEGVTEIGGQSFSLCTGLTGISIPASIRDIQSSAFSYCPNLETITFAPGSQLQSIGQHLFYGSNNKITSITIPASVMSIDSSAFEHCSSLTTINIDAGNLNYASEGGILYNKDKTQLILAPIAGINGTVAIPASVTHISDYAFSSCTNLTGVTIPEGVTYIGSRAFTDTNLTSITIPVSVTEIGQFTFWSSSLTSVIFLGGPFDYFGEVDCPPFQGDLRAKYLAGGPGTYTRLGESDTWSKL